MSHSMSSSSLSAAPLLAANMADALPSSLRSQARLLGVVESRGLQLRNGDGPRDSLYLNPACTASTLVVGPDDVHRSNTVQTLLTSLLQPNSDSSSQAGNALVLYISECVAGLAPLPCKLAAQEAVSGISTVVLVPEYRLEQMKKVYAGYPVEVRALKFNNSDFTEAGVFHPACVTSNTDKMPWDHEGDFKALAWGLRSFAGSTSKASNMQVYINGFINESNTTDHSSDFGATSRTFIVDLSCPAIGSLTSSLWFNMAIRHFMQGTQKTRKVLVCENAEMYLKQTSFQQQLNKTVGYFLQHHGHVGLNTIISTMSLCDLPLNISSLTSCKIIQRNSTFELLRPVVETFFVDSPDNHAALVGWLNPTTMDAIGSEVLVVAPSALLFRKLIGQSKTFVQRFGRACCLVNLQRSHNESFAPLHSPPLLSATSVQTSSSRRTLEHVIKDEPDDRSSLTESFMGYKESRDADNARFVKKLRSLTPAPPAHRGDEVKAMRHKQLIRAVQVTGQGEVLLSAIGIVCKASLHELGVNTNKPGWLRKIAESAEGDGLVTISKTSGGQDTVTLSPSGLTYVD